MSFIEVQLLNGNTFSIRKDLILSVMRVTGLSKEELKQNPRLKDALPYTVIQVSIQPGAVYCSDSYEDVMLKLDK